MTNDGIKERTTSARKQCPAFVCFVCSSSFQRNKKEIGEHPSPLDINQRANLCKEFVWLSTKQKTTKNQIEMTEITKANDSPKILFCFVFLRDE